jgi:uncharacterized membrane protein
VHVWAFARKGRQMTENRPQRKLFALHLRGTLIAGLLTIAPLIAVWLVFDFLLNLLFEAGHPMATALADFLNARDPNWRPWLADTRAQYVIAIGAALLVLYVIGWIASRVVGVRLIALYERIIERIPLAESIYSATKKLVGVLQQKPDSASRVVLIEFPHPGLRALGFVMRTFPDSVTGVALAAVLVPTAPNPTTGYLQIVPAEKLVPTDMTMDQAMSMIISGGATAPDHLSLTPRT